MSKAYLQFSERYPEAANGYSHVLLGDGTTLADVFDPITGVPVANPVPINADGFVGAYHVENGTVYNIKIYGFLGNLVFERESVTVPGDATGTPGTNGKSVRVQAVTGGAQVYDEFGNTVTVLDGPAGPTGPAGATGATGPAGATGATGSKGADGIAGYIQLPALPVDPSTVPIGQPVILPDGTLWTNVTGSWTTMAVSDAMLQELRSDKLDKVEAAAQYVSSPVYFSQGVYSTAQNVEALGAITAGTGTNNVMTAIEMRRAGLVSMADGYGVCILAKITDQDQVNNAAGRIAWVRDGADNSASAYITTYLAGSEVRTLDIRKDGTTAQLNNPPAGTLDASHATTAFVGKPSGAAIAISSSQTITPANGAVYYIPTSGILLAITNSPPLGTRFYVQFSATALGASSVFFSDVAGNALETLNSIALERFASGWIAV